MPPPSVPRGDYRHGGRFNKDVKSPRFRVTEGGAEFVIAWARKTAIKHDIVICQKDIGDTARQRGDVRRPAS
jgi:hypothetical protein